MARLNIPSEGWIKLKVPAIDTILYCGTHVAIPEHTIEVAVRYPRYEDGEPAVGMTQSNGETVVNITQQKTAEFLRDYPEFRTLALYEDQLLRDTLGRDHPIFDENFQRNGMPWRWGYVLDFNRPYDNGADGVMINGQTQRLVTREIGYRLPSGEVILGVTTIAPSGMVPTLTKAELEACGVDLIKLEKLGVSISDSGDEAIRPLNAFGYPQLTLPHDYMDGKVSHSHHLWTPTQNDSERVGVRDADWLHHGVDGCFRVDLDYAPDDSGSDGSFPLVRGGRVSAGVERAFGF